MIVAKKKSNIFLILVLFSAIAFYGYFISQNKGSKKIDTNEAAQNSEVSNIEKGVTTFKDVEYKTTDAKNRDYITKGNEAKITKDKPDLIELKTVHSFTNLKDGTVLNVNSEKADYFKKTKLKSLINYSKKRELIIDDHLIELNNELIYIKEKFYKNEEISL